MANGKFIAYYRVSTEGQGRSGLGLEAQTKAVADYLNGGAWELIAEFTEVESGKRNDRPELARAMAAAKKAKATLIIAKLDRLARNVHFVSGLMEAGVDFVAVDMPTADRFTLHIHAAVAEQEAKKIGERTRAALMAAKARGKALGWSNPNRGDTASDASKAAVARLKADADNFAANVILVVRDLQKSGLTTLAAIAKGLNDRGIRPARGKTWYPTTVKNLIARAAAYRSFIC